MQKTSSNSFPILLLLVGGLLSLVACKNKQQPSKLADVSSYVYAYTSGVISKNTPIRARFTQEVIPADQIGTPVDNSIFTITPAVEGTATWENTHTLLFEPATTFASGTPYQVNIALNQLFTDATGKASDFIFDFTTKELRFDVVIEGLRSASSQDLSNQKLVGEVSTADQAASELVKKSLTARQGGKELPITWQSVKGGTVHQFVVEGVSRETNTSEVQLNWDAAALNIKDQGTKSVEVPALDDFKVIDATVVQEVAPHIVINFSDPLLKSQELKGLVSIDKYSGRLKYVVDGNSLKVYPQQRLIGKQTVAIQSGIKNVNGTRMKKNSTWNVAIADIQPAIRLAGTGNIIPNANGLLFPFEAVSLTAVDIEIFKVYDSNILQFLQTNNLDGQYDLERVGTIILQEKVNLQELHPTATILEWTRYVLDLGSMVDKDPYAIYQVRLGFRPAYSTYNCLRTTTDKDESDLTLMDNPFEEDGEIKSIWGNYYGIEGRYEGFEWHHRDNPCFPAYYNNERFVRRNIIASDLGIIAKKGKHKEIMVAVSDIKTTTPMIEVQLEFYDYQQQLIKTTATDGSGLAKIELDKEPFVVIASRGGQKGYLKLMDANSLSLSRFDVTGTTAQKGLKGFIYGERGVWRPGDSIYLHFILEDKQGKLPANHPISFELVNPRGQVQKQWTTSENINNIYPLVTATTADAPTGNWLAKVAVGGAKFTKRLKIETVKPNRLKINLDFGKETLTAVDKDLSGKVQVNWLHGAPAQNVDVKIETQIKAINTSFDKYKEYEFDDPARRYTPEPITVFEDKVNAEGNAAVQTQLSSKNVAPGMLLCNFQTRAFEKGGDFSTDNFSIKYSPYDAYAGVYLKKNKYGEKRMDIGKEGKIDFIAVDEQGNPLRGRNLKIGLYRVEWRWWWDSGRDNISKYNSASHYGAVQSGNIRTNGKGETDWSVNISDWGRYLVRVCDAQSGHCSGDFFYAGYPWYDDEAGGGNRNAAAMLAFTADKEKYQTGEEVSLTIPSSEGGRALISIESGDRILETYWTDTEAGETNFSFYTTPAMTPTVYANVSLIQPHAQVKNDLPIRLYGVIPINVEDQATRLDPILTMPEVLEPEQTVSVQVSEKSGKPMAYTIAMVDDGLLDLTRFKTPNPWSSFYAREALGVKTWDVYDHVLGAYGGEMERILAIGGDAALAAGKKDEKANRFKPVVKHLGPFYLESGTATHQITVPNYVGSVRTMVVAANNGAYGQSEATTPVRKPLMVLASLPRVLGPTEELTLPVTVFAMEDKVKNVQVMVEETSGLVKITGDKVQTIAFAKPGESVINFDLQVGQKIGIAKFKITAKGGGETAIQNIELDIRNPNPFVNNIQEKVLQPGENWSTIYEAAGMRGTNTGILEVSNIPPIDLGKRLQYLLRYPHGCIEQTTSSGFPQLFVNKLMEVDNNQQARITNNITATIERLKQFQISSGAFGYWPGDTYASQWGTNYAGHFLLEAQALGYTLPSGLLNNWKRFQKKQANNWNQGDSRYNNDLTQAYRLYTLALANTPEIGAMNRLRAMNTLSDQAKWRLAAAYAQTGRIEVAEELVNKLSTNVEDYRELSYTYGSGLRDEAMILETLVKMKDLEKAGKVAKNMSKQLSSGSWYGTQTVAYSLLAIGKMVGKSAIGDSYNFTYQVGNETAQDAGSTSPIMNIDIPVDAVNNTSLTLTNNSKSILYTKLVINGQPLIGDQTVANEDLNMAVIYTSLSGDKIDPERIPQGTDFVAQVTITNPGKRGIRYDEMALTQIFPSGWEILNTRMSNIDRFKEAATPEYQDIRDDRVYSYFDINRSKTQRYVVQLNAAYQGRYYLPTVACEAMYDNTIYARQPGQWVTVVAPKEL